MQVIKEAKTDNNVTWYLAKLNGTELGWIDSRAFTATVYSTLISETASVFSKLFDQSTRNDGIHPLPHGTKPDIATSANAKTYHGQMAQVSKIAVTEKQGTKVTWYYTKVNGKILGWVDSRAFTATVYSTLISETASVFSKLFDQSTRNDGIHPLPHGIKPDIATSANAKTYHGKMAQVSKVAVTEKQGTKVTWLYVSINGKALGWVDERAFDTIVYATVISEEAVTFARHFDQSTRNDGIHPLPYWTAANIVTSANAKAYHGQLAQVSKTIVTERQGVKITWLYISVNGKVLGWIDERAFTTIIYAVITKQTTVDFLAKFNQATRNDGIHPLPYWTAVTIPTTASAKTYDGQTVRVTKQAITVRKDITLTWNYVSVGNKALGWVNSEGFTSL